MEEKTSVLIVDDNTSLVRTMSFVLRRQGYAVASAQDGEQAIAMVKESHFGVILIEMKLPTINGLETYLKIKEIQPESAVILMTAHRQEMLPQIKKALNNNAHACLYKPFAMEDLLKLAEEIREKKQRVISTGVRKK